MIGAGFYSIWHARNSIHFKESRPTAISLIRSFRLQIHEVDSWGLGTMCNSVDELCLFHSLGIHGRSMKAPQIHEVTWLTPHAFQVKVNTDGAARGSPGLAGCGGIFRDNLGCCLGCFAGSMGVATTLEAELQAIIHVVSMASQNGWRTLWIEYDSTLALHFLSTSSLSFVPWRLCVA